MSPLTRAETVGEQATVDRVVRVAINHFAQRGYADTKLETIARESGMSKRMIHYRFGDKQGLYQQALGAAARRLAPKLSELKVNSTVPVEGVRVLVDIIYRNFVAEPEAVRMLTQESVIQSLDTTTRSAVADLSDITLHLDKLLMRGHDSGAFRPGISANDIFTIIASLSMYRTTNREMMLNILGVDMTNEVNTEGMHRLAVDTVLAFLTSNIPDSGKSSYLTAEPDDSETEAAADIYGTEASPYDD
ncbi:TetR family transcriptional regulator [Corynebacterium phocae]|uniref:TetR family transcriptional regulator n=1 Tax=Corynebacterium phocae TaxID=161895 RepID=A0A1L7D269_9CORY|nr:TetR/AcrR family transcriptional regulator [Corynebacterium phocae]APT92061.1 TetR family transcriptional regulator [Corynebacterium phocae]KAA8726444.1 TetR/AcrR family transcriptional regulator [Corynebacterium phocae]